MPKLNQRQLDMLQIATRNAAQAASEIFSKWAKRTIQIRMDKVESVPFHEVIPRSEPLDPVSLGLYLQLTQDLEGSLLFLLREQTGFSLVDSLMNRAKGTTKSLGDIERSALLETGNIVGSAYINSLVKELKLKQITPGPPVLFHDITQSILESVVMQTSQAQDEALLVHVTFSSGDQALDWRFFFLPLHESLTRLLGKP